MPDSVDDIFEKSCVCVVSTSVTRLDSEHPINVTMSQDTARAVRMVL